jgi:copper(I)-binding protein
MRFRSSRLIGLIFLVALLSTTAHPGQPAIDIQVTQAWIRWLPQNLPAGGYMTVINTGAAARVLIGATSPDYAEVSFHQTRDTNGTSTMVPVASIVIAPHATVSFSPGGYHMMLMRPAHSLHPGDRVTMSLRFADGQKLDVQLEVRAAAASDADSSTEMPAMPGMR